MVHWLLIAIAWCIHHVTDVHYRHSTLHVLCLDLHVSFSYILSAKNWLIVLLLWGIHMTRMLIFLLSFLGLLWSRYMIPGNIGYLLAIISNWVLCYRHIIVLSHDRRCKLFIWNIEVLTFQKAFNFLP